MLTAACSTMPLYWPDMAMGPLTYWATAVDASTADRDSMWQAAKRDNIEWQLALLQSLPDYHRYDPDAARRGLKEVLARNPYGEVAALAQVRLADLATRKACQSQVVELQRRLSDVIAIERKLDDNGR
ncbi:MAG: hypothetical protein ACLGI7_05955 [Gammaproteobacteria bacterium]